MLILMAQVQVVQLIHFGILIRVHLIMLITKQLMEKNPNAIQIFFRH